MEYLRAYDGDAYRKAAQELRDVHGQMLEFGNPAIKADLIENTGMLIQHINYAATHINLKAGLTPEQKREAMLLLVKAVSAAGCAIAEVETPNTNAEVKAPGSARDLQTDMLHLQTILGRFGHDGPTQE